ncbi:hypothetical protein [uncultured Methanolobus sp.]|uniref:hypothetical protein n=1 Tax=uncultured Methanolobus sp. TaxID=218300 RepID=UPI002AAB4F22|nr:hypothetical protein [uncultured Methanolobus sp.]
MEWSVQFKYNEDLDPVFINKFFDFLVSKGVKYNINRKGRYNISPDKHVKSIGYFEEEIKDSTKKIPEVVKTFVNYDLKKASFSIFLDYVGEVDFYFIVFIGHDDDKSLIAFDSNDYAVPDDETFFAFMDLCKEVFVKFGFSYGAFRDEDHESIPMDEDEFLKEKADTVNFYSEPLVDKIGRERLLSTPARKVEELENGGVMLIVCTEALGCPEEFDKVWRHLGYR